MIFRPRISKRTPSNSWFAELHTTPGPVAIGEVGHGQLTDLVSGSYLAVIDEETSVADLFQFTDAEWNRLQFTHPIFGHELGESARHLTLAFDQAAQPVAAMEEAGTITVTRWDPVEKEFVQNASFPGVDPVVAFDAVWMFDVGESDIIIFYLAPDRLSIRYRLQRDVFAVEYTLETLGEAAILDRVLAGEWQYSLLMSTIGNTPLVFDSERYPPNITVMDAMGVSAAGPVSGDYFSVVIERDFDDGVAVMATGPASGAYTDPVFEEEYTDGIAVGGAGPASGDYVYVILDEGGDDAIAVSGAGPGSGAYRYVIIDAVDEQEGIAVSATGPAGGVYEPA